MDSVEGRPSSRRGSGLTTTAPRADSRPAKQPWVPHLFDLINAASDIQLLLNIDIPTMYHEPAAIDSATLIGHGASFTASVRSLPPGPETVSVYVDMGGWTVNKVAKAPSRPSCIVYKTARVAFDEYGEPMPGYTSALESVLTELHALTYPSLFRHPNIISLLALAWGTNEYNPQHRLPALIVEYADRGTLADLLATQPPTSDLKVALCFDIASGLQAIHRAGLIHGDVKTESILICSGERRPIAKLAHFGYSVVAETELDHVWLGGTFPWTAPETAHAIPPSELEYTDIFSFGLLIWTVAIDGFDPFNVLLGSPDRASSRDTAFAARIQEMKTDGRLLVLSRPVLWLQRFLIFVIQRPELHLIHADSIRMQVLRRLMTTGNNGSGARLIVRSLIADDRFLSKLGKIFVHTLSPDPHARELDRVLRLLSEGVDEAPIHDSRLSRSQPIKYQVTNNSGSTKQYQLTSDVNKGPDLGTKIAAAEPASARASHTAAIPASTALPIGIHDNENRVCYTQSPFSTCITLTIS